MKKANLYWVSTDDHCEDWFVIARTKKQAEKYHEDSEGYDRGDAWAEKIRTMPDHPIEDSGPHWPSRLELKDAGAGFFYDDGGVEPCRLGDSVFFQGSRFRCVDADGELVPIGGYGVKEDYE